MEHCWTNVCKQSEPISLTHLPAPLSSVPRDLPRCVMRGGATDVTIELASNNLRLDFLAVARQVRAHLPCESVRARMCVGARVWFCARGCARVVLCACVCVCVCV